jgi:hypothetical protein
MLHKEAPWRPFLQTVARDVHFSTASSSPALPAGSTTVNSTLLLTMPSEREDDLAALISDLENGGRLKRVSTRI